MNRLEFEQFKAEAKLRHEEHVKDMGKARYEKYDWTGLLDRYKISGQEREKFLKQRRETVEQIPYLLGLMEGK